VVVNFLLKRKILLACRLYYDDQSVTVEEKCHKKELCSHIRLLCIIWQKDFEGTNKISVKADTTSTKFRIGHLPGTD